MAKHLSITINEQSEREVRYYPCINCGSGNIDFNDCGYTTFNVAWGRCKRCGNEVKINNCSYDVSKEYIISEWNKRNNPVLLIVEYEQEINDLQEKIKHIKAQKNNIESNNLQAEIDKKKLLQELSTWSFLAETLDQDHQQEVKSEILMKIKAIREQLRTIKL